MGPRDDWVEGADLLVSLMAERTMCGEAVGVEEVKLGVLVHRSVEYTRASHQGIRRSFGCWECDSSSRSGGRQSGRKG